MDQQIQRSVIDAIRERYLDSEMEDQTDQDAFRLKQKYRKNDLVIELVGLQEATQVFKSLHGLQQISLERMQITCAKSDEMEEQQFKEQLAALKSVRLLNLSANCLQSWTDVLNVVSCIPSLQQLILSENPLESVDKCVVDAQTMKQTLKKIHFLVVGKMNLEWNQVQKLASIFSGLRSFDVHCNRIENIDSISIDLFQNLDTFDLSQNPLRNWSSVCQLGRLSKLSRLILNECEIDEISFDSNQSNLFASLTHLNVNGNQIKDWISIANLNFLPSLKSLDVRRNPLLENLEHDYRVCMVIGRLDKIVMLDREEINKVKRMDSEIYYLRAFYRDWVKCGKTSIKFQQEHPRFLHLIEMYGEPKELLQQVETGMKFVVINFINQIDSQTISQKILRNMEIKLLKMKAKRLFKMNSLSDVRLICKSKRNTDITYELDSEDKNLKSYDIEDGDVIEVFEVDDQ